MKPDDKSKSKLLVQFGWYELPENNSIVRFCQDSGLHGIKYITGPNQHLCERLFWLVALIISTVAGSYLIYNLWDQYYNLPVIFVPSPKKLSIDQLPFPSVTVCSLNRVSKDTYETYYNLANQNDDESNSTVQEAKEIVRILDSLCNPDSIFQNSMLSFKIFGMGILPAFINLELSQSFHNGSRFMKLIEKSVLRCPQMIPVFNFDSSYHIYGNPRRMEEVETDFGICCTVNAYPAYQLKPWKNITRKGFKNPNPWQRFTTDTLQYKEDKRFPYWQKSPGVSHGLSLVLKTNTNQSHCNDPDLNGFMVSIANPLDAPSTRDKASVVEFDADVQFTLKPKITFADDSIKRFKPGKRNCYFENEWPLRDHSVYTQSNCFNECIANLTMKHCQPLADCWGVISEFTGLQRDWLYGQLCQVREPCNYTFREEVFGLGTEEACKHCLPTCNDIKYEYNTQVKPLKDYHVEKLEKYGVYNARKNGNISVIHVYFDEYYTTSTIRKEQFGILELLANSGGLLGLCLGFSGVSILEMIYYFTIRVWFRHFRRKLLLRNNGISQENTPVHKNVAEQNIKQQ